MVFFLNNYTIGSYVFCVSPRPIWHFFRFDRIAFSNQRNLIKKGNI